MRRSPGTLLEKMREHLAADPHAVAIRRITDGIRETAKLSRAALDRAARRVPDAIREAGAAGERVLIAMSPGLELVGAPVA